MVTREVAGGRAGAGGPLPIGAPGPAAALGRPILLADDGAEDEVASFPSQRGVWPEESPAGLRQGGPGSLTRERPARSRRARGPVRRRCSKMIQLLALLLQPAWQDMHLFVKREERSIRHHEAFDRARWCLGKRTLRAPARGAQGGSRRFDRAVNARVHSEGHAVAPSWSDTLLCSWSPVIEFALPPTVQDPMCEQQQWHIWTQVQFMRAPPKKRGARDDQQRPDKPYFLSSRKDCLGRHRLGRRKAAQGASCKILDKVEWSKFILVT